jgi:hypothetical protein
MSKGINPRRVIEYFIAEDVEIAQAVLDICQRKVDERMEAAETPKPKQKRQRKPKANGAAGATAVTAPTPVLSFPPQDIDVDRR